MATRLFRILHPLATSHLATLRRHTSPQSLRKPNLAKQPKEAKDV